LALEEWAAVGLVRLILLTAIVPSLAQSLQLEEGVGRIARLERQAVREVLVVEVTRPDLELLIKVLTVGILPAAQ
jgi:hypothetical protein